MHKPKKGKFRYRLDSVLNVREIREKQHKEVFAEKERILIEEKKKEEEIKNWEDSLNQQLRKSLVGEIKDFGSILRRRSHLVKVKEDVVSQEEKRVDAETAREAQRVKLVDAMKDRKIIEQDKGNKKDSWKKLMDHEEMNFLDDIATSQFNRNKEQK